MYTYDILSMYIYIIMYVHICIYLYKQMDVCIHLKVDAMWEVQNASPDVSTCKHLQQINILPTSDRLSVYVYMYIYARRMEKANNC